MMKTRTGFVALVLALAAAPAGAQSDSYRQQLDRQLESSRDLLKAQGFSVAAGPFTGALGANGKERFTLPVEEGVTYKIVGVCDTDCSDADLRVFNLNGENIGEDVADDDVPIVELEPTGSGAVQLEAHVVACSSEPCYHAIEVYWKR